MAPALGLAALVAVVASVAAGGAPTAAAAKEDLGGKLVWPWYLEWLM